MTREQARLAALTARLADARVMVVGDVMLDRFVEGAVSRISPEAPIPILKVTGEQRMLGGAGNVSRNLTSLGVKNDLAAVVGADGAGDEVAALVKETIGGEGFLLRDGGRQTTVKTRFVAGNQQILRADAEDAAPAPEELGVALCEAVSPHLTPGVVLVLSDYGKGVLTPLVTRRLVRAAKTAGVPIVADPKGRDFSRYAGAALLTPNLRELELASGRPAAGDAAVTAAASQVIEEAGVEALLVTRSAEGMTLVTASGAVHHQGAEAREVFDVSGAGDTVVAAMAAAMSSGADLVDAMALANIAAGVVVGKVGTAAVHADDVMRELRRWDLSGADQKVQALEPLLDRVRVWRRQGLKIGFTNGCFDLLHPGHVSLLAQARAACDRLIVGLNSDASVKRLKGADRPVQGELARATVLGSLGDVDAVVVFGEDTPLELISRLAPDVLVKGADYTVEKVVGADIVRKAGGKVVLAELAPGQSTTRTIKRLKS